MMSFLKSYLSNEKTAEEKTLAAQHDVLKLDTEACSDDESCETEEAQSYGGCCGGGCRQ